MEKKETRSVGGNTHPDTKKSKSWFFTWNNYTENSEPYLKKCFELGEFTYLKYQKEIGEDKKTPHLQGLFQTPTAITWKSCTNKFMIPHIETCRSLTGANNYVEKKETAIEGSQVILGEITFQGKRNDLNDLVNDIKNGMTTGEIMLKYPGNYLRYNRGIEKMMNKLQPKRKGWKPYCIYIKGDGGTGKSKLAENIMDKNGYDTYYQDGTQWWDGYDGETGVIIDEFKGMDIQFMNRLIDYYPMAVQIKGGYIGFNKCKLIIITSNYTLEELYTEEKDKKVLECLKRRIDRFIEL